MIKADLEISVIDASQDWPRYSRRLEEILDSSGMYRAVEYDFPENPEAVVISGSTSGIYEDESWIDELVNKTEEYISRRIPVLGLCFGHQAIAEAMGARVVQMERYEIGYRAIRMDETPIFDGLNRVEHPFSVHQDRVENLPDELEVIARTDRSAQGIRHRQKPVFGVQFHPELTPPIAEKAIRTKNIEPERRKNLLQQVNQDNFERAKRALRIFENFAEIAEKGAPEQKPAGIRGSPGKI